MSSLVNPTYQAAPTAFAMPMPMPMPEPISAPYFPKPCDVPVAQIKHHKQHKCHKPYASYFNETGTILVLFVLLVIISRAWIV